MSIQAQLAMVLWLPIVVFFFYKFPHRKAVIIGFLGGLLFLPRKAGFPLPLIPDYEGMLATCYGILIGIFIFDSQIFRKYKFSWFDLPIILFGIAPLFSSVTNGLGLYDGVNVSISQTVTWGMPYLLGRLYFNNLLALKELAIYIVKAGLIYVPLCLYEIRMSPQIHRMVYGYFAHSFAQTRRFGGWRPQVFMSHGLMLGLFMMCACLIAIWLWQSKTVDKIWGVDIKWINAILFVTFVLCKSLGAYILILMGLGIMLCAKIIKINLPLFFMIVGIVGYLSVSASGALNIDSFTDFANNFFPAERVQSLEFRLNNEEMLGEKARERMIFGWGGWGRSRVYGENWAGEIVDISVTDSLWIIFFGTNGLFGLVNCFLMMLLPIARIALLQYPAKKWFTPQIAPSIVLAIALGLFAIDCLFNNMFNPMFPLIAGGLSELKSEGNVGKNKSRKIRIIKTTKLINSANTSRFPQTENK